MIFARPLVHTIEAHLGHYDQARVHLQQVLAMARESGQRWAIGAILSDLGHIALAEGRYADSWSLLRESVDVYRDSGQRSDVGRPLALLAGAARGLGQAAEARHSLREALQVAAEIHDLPTPLYALPVAALLAADVGNAERAVELYALASRYGHVAHSRLWGDIAGRRIASASTALSSQAAAAARERGRARDLRATVAELLGEVAEDCAPLAGV